MSFSNLPNLQDFFNFLSAEADFIANAEELNPSIRDLEVNLDFDEILNDLVNGTAIFEQNDSTEKANNKQNKRQRTIFTSTQIFYMENKYRQKNYLECAERIKIAQKLGLPEDTIKVWFQNRRTKDKRSNSKGQVLNEIPPAQFQNYNAIHQTFDSNPNINYTTSCVSHQFGHKQEVPNTHRQPFQNWNGYQQPYQGSNTSLVANCSNYSNENYPYQYGNHQQYNANYNYNNY